MIVAYCIECSGPVDDEVSYACGCKFSTAKIEEAYEHVAKTGHTIEVHGTLRPPKKEKITP